MKKLFVVLVGLSTLCTVPANAASLVVKFDQFFGENNAFGTTLTLTFANSTDNATTFSGADFIRRQWTDLADFGPSNLVALVGQYPETNLVGTNKSVAGTISFSTFSGQADLNFGFGYTETSPTLGFTPFNFSYVTGNRIRGPAMWTAIDGFFPNFYIDSAVYNATGTAADFTETTSTGGGVPAPGAAVLLGFGLLGLGAARRKLS